MTSFYGTDTISGCVLAQKYYHAEKIAANSIPATEHSTMVSWSREKEHEAYENVLSKQRGENFFGNEFDQFLQKCIQMVMFRLFRIHIIFSMLVKVSGERNYVNKLKHGMERWLFVQIQVKNTNEKDGRKTEDFIFVLGKPTEVLERLLDILYEKFGGHVNEKGYKVLDQHVRIIQGDGVNIKSIHEILEHIEKLKYSADNLVFGSGGQLFFR